MTRHNPMTTQSRPAKPVIDTHGHLLVPEANALAGGHPREAADSAAELASFSAPSVAANQAQLRRVWPQLTAVERRLADLDAIGVDVQVVGPMPMHRYWAEPVLAAKLTTPDQRGRRRALRRGSWPPLRARHATAPAPGPGGPRTGTRHDRTRAQGRQRLDERGRPRARRRGL